MPVALARDGTRIFYARLEPRGGTAGRLRTLLLIGPLGLDGRLWRLAVDRAHERGYRVLAVDNRGCGRSGIPWRPWTIRTMADDAVAVLDHAGVVRAHVCGPSLGGMVAQEIAIRHPRRVAALVLAASPPGLPRIDLVPYRAIARALLGPARRRLAAGESAEAEVRGALRLLVSPGVARNTLPGSPLWALVQELAETPAPARGRLWQLLAAATHVGWRRLGGISAPTQVQHGTADPVVPARAARTLTGHIPNAEVVLFKGARHALILERPEQVTRAALDFLAQQDALATAD
jgi:3-oxoadipate enol-lactonase